MTQTPPEPPPTAEGGRIANLIGVVQTLSWTNVGVIVVLVAVATPLYLGWRAVNDQALLDRFLSHYREIGTDTSCLLREVRQRGGPDTWGLSTGFAYFGNDRWVVSVVVNHEPTPEEIISHCEVLNLTVDWMRDPAEHEIPKIPKTNKPLIWQYPVEDKGFHQVEPPQ